MREEKVDAVLAALGVLAVVFTGLA